MAKSIPTTSFYGSRRTTIRITNHGVEEKEANLGIIVPDAFNSDIEDEESDENENNDVIIRGDMNISNDDDGEDSDDCDDYHYDVNEHGENNVFSFPENPVPDIVVNTTPEGTSVTRKSATKSKATMKIPMPRWRKREAAVVNSVFCGEPLPSPPNEVLTPIEYFKNFFDDQLIGHISEQTNLYSVQKNGRQLLQQLMR
ncbi:uncharacterized protein LOC135691480 [Rhopilema esculentum]|uniref:uncharacterized protein LOC135691480 n=1 Tax=Rhopilema esculentum TaxID=499914 RepID=UPI0031DE136A